MSKKKTIISIILILLLLGLLDPFQIFMPTMFQMTLLVFFGVIYILFLGLIWQEQARDEREDLNRMFAARWAFFAGVVILGVGLMVQGFQHRVDPWIVFALIVMTVTKVFGRARVDNDK
jgi:uncharacterized membrane protein